MDQFMQEAIEEARAGLAEGGIPIGSVIVHRNRIIGRGRNRTRELGDPTVHAEMEALREAARQAGAARLPGAVCYTTVEPCFMCAGALSHARVARVVWGVRDPKFGGCASLGHVLSDERLNHRAQSTEGVQANAARTLLQEFFRSKRG